MRRVLVGSRSFGKVVAIGEEILSKEGFIIQHIKAEERPLDEPKMSRIAALENPDVIICGAEPITASVLNAAPKLRMVMKHGVGVDNIDLEAASAINIVAANAPGTNNAAVADLTIAVMLALLRALCQASNSTKAGGWDRYMGNELGEMIVGIVGTGRIGSDVLKRLQGFGSKILAYDIVRNPNLESKYHFRYVALEELLKISDIVTLHVPLMDKTQKMIGLDELKLMKKTAFLVNLARGELVDEDALLKHLKAKRIAGAALDVFSTEPPQKSPLLQLENVLATPHIAAYTYESMERMDRVCAEIIVETFRGKLSPSILNPETLNSFKP